MIFLIDKSRRMCIIYFATFVTYIESGNDFIFTEII